MIRVACGIIEQNNKVLCAQRSASMRMPFKWEFPGGKVEANENDESCLKREIFEELDVNIELIEQLPSTEHSYVDGLHILLIPFRCRIMSGTIFLKEHKQFIWLDKGQLGDLDWAEADIPIVEYYKNYF